MLTQSQVTKPERSCEPPSIQACQVTDLRTLGRCWYGHHHYHEGLHEGHWAQPYKLDPGALGGPVATEPPFPPQLHQPIFHGHGSHGMRVKVSVGSQELGSSLPTLWAQAFQVSKRCEMWRDMVGLSQKWLTEELSPEGMWAEEYLMNLKFQWWWSGKTIGNRRWPVLYERKSRVNPPTQTWWVDSPRLPLIQNKSYSSICIPALSPSPLLRLVGISLAQVNVS